METKNPKEHRVELSLSYTAWKTNLVKAIPDEEGAKDVVLDQARQFEGFYQKNHGNELIERTYSNGKGELLKDLTDKTYVSRENIPEIMIALQKLTYNEFQKTKDLETLKY